MKVLKETSKPFWQKILFFAMVVFGFLFIVLAAYPGFMSPDSLDQYNQAKQGAFSDWHPPFMAWLWSKLLFFYDGPQPLLVLNNLLYWSAALIISLKIRRFWVSFLFLMLCFAPPLINFLGVIWKDTTLLCVLFFQSSLLFWYYNQQLTLFKKVLFLIVFLLLGLVGILIRHNAVFALIPILGSPFFLLFRMRSFLGALMIGLILSACLFFVANKVNTQLCKGEKSFPQQQLMVYDLMGLSVRENKNLFPEYLKNKLTLDTLPFVYSPCDGALYAIFYMQCITKNQQQYNSLKRSWETEVLAHPVLLLKHKYQSFKCLFFQSSLTTYPFIHPNEYGFKLPENNIVRDSFVHYTESQWAKKLYQASIYLILGIIALIILLVILLKTQNRELYLSLGVLLSGFFYAFGYFPLSPCNDLRYNYWTIGALLLGIIFAVHSLTSNKVNK